MTISNIPTSTTLANYVFTVELDTLEFQLDFAYNDRDEAWYFNILDVNDNVLRGSLKVVNEWTLLRQWIAATRPAGEMIAVNQGVVLSPATLNQLGAEVILTYLDAEEIAALG